MSDELLPPPQDRVSTWRLDRPIATGLALTLGGLIAYVLGTAVSQLTGVLISIAFALFAALGLAPIVQRMQRRGMSRAWSIAIVYSTFALVAAGVIVLIAPRIISQIAQVISSLPSWLADVQKTTFYGWLDSTFGDEASSLVDKATSFLTQPSNVATVGQGVLHAGVTATGVISGALIALVLSLYFLAALPQMKAAFVRLMPAHSRSDIADMTDEIASSVGGYLNGMVVLALCNSVVAFVLHLALGLPVPLLMGLAAFCITLIPLIGSVLYWGIATVLALFTGWVPALVFAVAYLVYMQLEAYVLTPKVMNRAISVPGALVVIGALAGGTLLGLLGALVAIPVTASILLIVKRVYIPKQDARF